MANKYLDYSGLSHLWTRIKEMFVAKESGKGLSSNDFTDDEKSKLATVSANAKPNVQSDWTATSGDAFIKNKPSIPTKSSDIGAVPATRTINGKELSANISLTAADIGARSSEWMPTATEIGARPSDWLPSTSDIGAVPTSRKVNNKSLTSDINLTASDVGSIPSTRKINNKVLTSDITLEAGDVGARALDWMPTAAEVGARPSTWTPSASDVGAVPTTRTVNDKALSSDVTLTASDVGAVPTTRKVNGKALSSNITLSASDLNAIASSEKGVANGVATLDSDGLIPSYVDDVVEVYVVGATPLAADWFSNQEGGSPISAQTGKIYVVAGPSDSEYLNLQYRWASTMYVKITSSDVTPITSTEIDDVLVT